MEGEDQQIHWRTSIQNNLGWKNRSTQTLKKIINKDKWKVLHLRRKNSVMEWLRMEGTSGSHLVQHCRSSRNTQSSLPSTISRWLLNSKKISKKRDSAFLGNLFHCSVNSTCNNTDSCTPRTPSPCRQQAECSTSEYNPLCSLIAVAWSSCIFQQWKQISSDTTERVMIYKVSQNAPDIRCAKYRFSTSSKRLGEKRRMTFPIKIDNDIPVLKKRALKGPVTM